MPSGSYAPEPVRPSWVADVSIPSSLPGRTLQSCGQGQGPSAWSRMCSQPWLGRARSTCTSPMVSGARSSLQGMGGASDDGVVGWQGVGRGVRFWGGGHRPHWPLSCIPFCGPQLSPLRLSPLSEPVPAHSPRTPGQAHSGGSTDSRYPCCPSS